MIFFQFNAWRFVAVVLLMGNAVAADTMLRGGNNSPDTPCTSMASEMGCLTFTPGLYCSKDFITIAAGTTVTLDGSLVAVLMEMLLVLLSSKPPSP
jgi:hypothetical protein